MTVTPQQPLKVGLLGTGLIAGPHVHALRGLRGFAELVAVCDRDVPKAKAFQQKWGVAGVYGSVDEMIQNEKLDVVHVLLPPTAHGQGALACIQNGCHVFVEKPFCVSSAESRRVIDAGREHGRQIGVNHNLTFMPTILRLLDEIRSCRLGGVQHVSVGFNLPMKLASGPHTHWMFASPEHIILEVAPHPVSVVERLVGRVTGAGTAISGKRTLSNGQTFYSSWQSSLACERGTAQLSFEFGGHYRGTTVHVICQDGEAFADVVRNTFRLSEKTPYYRTENLRDAWRNGLAVFGQGVRNFGAQISGMLGLAEPYDMQTLSVDASIRAFYEALAAGRRVPVDGTEGLAVVEGCEAVIRSANVLSSAEGMEHSVAAR